MEHTATTLSLLEALGFLVNYPISVLMQLKTRLIINNEGAESSTGKDGSDSYSGAP